MSSFAGNSDGAMTGLCPAPPPPPPPPVPGQLPAMRIKTAEAPAVRRPQMTNNEGYEPPAAIQNAMLTKDKKPFTYTPGMGGKLDLSQIRSPRMARRVAKNANDEGIEGPPKSALEPKPTPTTPNLFVQPQVAVPVFPTNIPPQTPVNRTPPTPPTPPVNRFAPNGNVAEKVPEPVRIVTKAEPRVVAPATPVSPSTPESPGTPTQVTLTKAPTPWMQNKNKPQEELPEWAKRTGGNKQSSSSPESPSSPPVYATQAQPQWQAPQQKQQPVLRQQFTQQPQGPQQFNQQPQQFNQQAQQKRQFTSPTQQATSPQSQQERVVPMRIEDRPSVFDVKHEGGHHQFKQQPPSPHHQQRWGQAQNQVQAQQPAQQSSGGGYIIPIMVEANDKRGVTSGPGSNTSYSQPTGRNSTLENARVVQRGPSQTQEPGPVQSRSFRVLQKITDTDATNDAEPDQLRKLQLTEDDRVLMNKFKEQVDSDSFLHHEEDPRYRGAAIPSRAFRFLQTMTDGGEVPVASTAPRAQNSAINKKQNRNSKSFEESQANLPPSEQQVQEPKKYMGSAIPSRSFRILQAMTAPESIATQDNRQADYTCQTENNMPGNQQAVFYPPCPPTFWNPDGSWWGYYPLPYPNSTNDPKTPYQDTPAYVYYPIYSQNYPPYYNNVNGDKSTYPPMYPQYALPINPQSNQSNQYCEPINDSTNQDFAMNLTDNRLQDTNAKLPNRTNNLNVMWDENISRTASTNSKDSDCTTAMNITDEEELPETVVADGNNEVLQEVDETKPSGSLNINMPNYTYIDTSDSSESTDSETHSDNESVVESTKSSSISNNNRESDNSSSDSDDSDSYLAYSTGLNPRGRCDDRNGTKVPNEEKENDESSSSSEKMNDSDLEEQTVQEAKGSTSEQSFPHKLSVIYEEQSESPRPLDREVWSGRPFEATDDPPDDTDSTTVSVSLPLRFKFSVSENNEDVTTVIVGDSTIKEERKNKVSKIQENRTTEAVNDVSADYQVGNETTVDFTVKRQASEVKKLEKVREEEAVKKSEETPHVNFTLRKIPTRLGKMNCEETTEYTIKSKKSTRKEEIKEEVNVEGPVKEASKGAGRETGIANFDSLANNINNTRATKVDQNKFELEDFKKNLGKPEVVVSECVWNEDPNKSCENSSSSRTERRVDSNFSSNPKMNEDERASEIDEKAGKEPKHLLSVQNSREETDDEDSGVTSDMSRIISEVDTDSECTSSKNIRKYQRTQTHSRLFRLLNDDSILPETSHEPSNDSSSRREYLSLPLTAFNYDENYCSNYSSGLTSPEYSPSCEQSWRRLHDPESTSQDEVPRQLLQQDRSSQQEDPYYQTWKTPKPTGNNDVIPSLAFKTLESRRPFWSYKVNVLCPRIRSTKNVPRVLQSTTESSVPPVSMSYVNLRSEHC